MINEILRNTQIINSVQEPIFPEDILSETIVEIGSTTWERLFLLNDLLKCEILMRGLRGYTGWSMQNSNTKAVLKALNGIFAEEIASVYQVVFDDIPDFSLPADELFKAKQLKEKIIYKTSIIYKGILLYK
jgi:hypothetical protein